jgi:hypothetical protein
MRRPRRFRWLRRFGRLRWLWWFRRSRNAAWLVAKFPSHGVALSGKCDVMRVKNSPLSEIAYVLVCLEDFCHCRVASKKGRIHRVKYWQISLAILAAMSASIVLADDFKTIDGKEYKNAKISRVEPDGIVITFSGGIVKLPFAELPGDVQKKCGYDSSAAAAYSAKEYEKQTVLSQQRKADEQRRLEERQKYWSEHATQQPQQPTPQSARGLVGSALDRPAYNQQSGSMTPQLLVSEYARSEIKADRMYRGRIFTVSGIIKLIYRSGDKVTVELHAPLYYRAGIVAWLNCVFNDSSGLEQKETGNAITLTGRVVGMRGNALTMEDCHL